MRSCALIGKSANARLIAVSATVQRRHEDDFVACL
jgi:hypothetical protein